MHLSGRDLDTSVLKAYGISKAEEDTKPKLTVRECPRCKNKNELNSVYCASCGTPLDIQNAMWMGKEHEKLKEAIISSIRDPTLLDEIADLLIKEKEKRRKKE